MNISLKNLKKQIRDEELFTCESLNLNNGIYIFVEENGCGKSTLFRMISKLDTEFRGDIYFDEMAISELDDFFVHSKLLAYQTQNNSLFIELSFKENLDLILSTYNAVNLENFLNVFNVKDIYNSKKVLSKCSGGERQKISLIINLLKDTPMLLLDEVDNSLDKESINNMVEYLRNVQDKSILIITHNLDFYESLDYTRVEYIDGVITVNQKMDSRIVNENSMTFEDYKVSILGETKLNQKVKLSRKLIGNSLALNLCLTVFTLYLMLYSISALINTFSMLNTSSSNYDEVSSIIQSPPENSLYYLYGDKSWFETTNYYFTDDDMEKLKNLDYVTKVVPMGLSGSEINTSGIEADGISYVINDGQNGMKYAFSNFVNPLIIRNHTEYDGLMNGKIVSGSSPADGSNEILIGTRYAKEILKVNDPNELLGKEVTIPAIDYYTNKEKDFKFKVSGIYQKPQNTKDDSEEQMIAYNPTSYTTKQNSCFLFEEQDIGRCIISNTEEKNREYVKEQNKNHTLGKYPNFYVQVKSKHDLKRLTKEVNKYDKYSLVDNNYSRKYNNGFIYLKKTIYEQILVFCVILAAYVIMLMLSNRLLKKKLMYIRGLFIVQGVDVSILKAAIQKNNQIIKFFTMTLTCLFSVWFIYYGIKQSMMLVVLIFIMLISIYSSNYLILKRREKYVQKNKGSL